MYNNKFKFNKNEKLCSRRIISELFESGKSFYSSPLTVLWMKSRDKIPSPAIVAISVGKKNFRKAVERNRIKRLLREAWRINKHKLYMKLEQLNVQIVIMIIYSGSKMPVYHDLEEHMENTLNSLLLQVNEYCSNKNV